MGKGFDKDKLRRGSLQGAVLALLILALLLASAPANAAHREFELFDQGYEYYLSYQPEKAAEALEAFMKEFPESSAGDAALFWLGKSLIRINSLERAVRAFREIKERFPTSLFFPFAEREEADIINKTTKEETPRPEEIVVASGLGDTKTDSPGAKSDETKIVASSAGLPPEKIPDEVKSEDTTAFSLNVPSFRGNGIVFDIDGIKPASISSPVESGPDMGKSTPVTAPLATESQEDMERAAYLIINRYAASYVAGDIESFISLYSASAVEKKTFKYADIKRAYQKTFETNRYEEYALVNVRLSGIDEGDNPRVAVTASYGIRRLDAPGKDALKTGTIRWTLQKENGVFRIVTVDYE